MKARNGLNLSSGPMKSFLACLLAGWAISAAAATTISDHNHYAYAANLGWVECRGDVASGAVIGEYVCSGYLYSANVGWIHLGNNAPANGIRYQNNSGTDYGVNHDGSGNLRGYAWGANIGWVSFESNGAPKVDLATGNLSGSIYSANCGWLSLSNTVALVQTASLAPGADSDGDGIADAWELTYTNTLSAFTGTSDTDHDGMTDLQEYLADTNPFDPRDNLRVTALERFGDYSLMEWTSKPTRLYSVQLRDDLSPASLWLDYFTLPLPGMGAAGFYQAGGQGYYRVRAHLPLSP